MQQTVVMINWLTDVKCPPSKFREELAKSNLFPSEFFHYGNIMSVFDVKKELVDGKLKTVSKTKILKAFDEPMPLSGRPPVRVIGGKTWVGIIADPGAEDLLLPHVGSILSVATKVAGASVKIEVKQYQFGITYTETPIRYMLREMAICRRGPAARAAEIEDLVAERIFGGFGGGSHYGIDGICANFGLEPPAKEMLEIRVFPLKDIGLHNKSSNGKSKEYVSLVDAEILMNAKLDGIWQVGNLTARGYGRLIKQHGGSKA